MAAPHKRAHLYGLTKAPQYNHHIVERLQGKATRPERCAVRVLSSGEQLSVPAAACAPLPRRGGPLVTPHDSLCEPALRRLAESALAQHLPRACGSELVDCVLSYLLLHPVQMECVRAVAASSCADHDRRSDPAHTLDPSPANWWISDSGSMPGGHGQQWVEYEVGPCPVVILVVHLTIPPLPSGPLSVRRFYFEATDEAVVAAGAPPRAGNEDRRAWRRASPDFTTLDVGSPQSFALVPPIEGCRAVRIVCTLNAAAALNASEEDDDVSYMSSIASCVGFFSVAFE